MEKRKQNYTEKVTLRLTPQDKENYQIEADKGKLPLTTYLRNKISGVQDENKEFQPQLISTDYSEYRLATHHAKVKIKKIDAIINEAKKLIDIPNKTSQDFKDLLNNPIGYVTELLYNKHSKSISFNISRHKLLELMEIDLSGLMYATNNYNKLKGVVIIDDDGNIKSGVNIGTYSNYTKCEADNIRLELAKTIIDCYEKANPYNSSITIGNIRDAFHPLLSLGGDDNSNSILIPCVGWVLGKR